MQWEDLPAVIDDWTLKAAAVGYDLRQHAAGVITGTHVGYYYDPCSDRVGVYAPQASAADAARVKAAAARVGEPLFLSYQQLADPAGTWVKVAYSQALRRAGELGNFFPGQFPGGIPNSPSPVAAMLTSGLIGAGLGWGGGKLLGKLLPNGYGDNLGRTGAVLGAALGATPGLAWGGTNKLIGRPFNDPALLDSPPGAEPINSPLAIDGGNMVLPARTDGDPLADLKTQIGKTVLPRKFAADVELCGWYKEAAAKAAAAFGEPDRTAPSPLDVNIDAVGRTLWQTGASPSLAGTTMGALYAAQQLPDVGSRPGLVTAHQLGQLAQAAAGDYARGLVVGAALNTVVGTPHRAGVFGLGNLALGVIGTVVPKLFGG